MPAEQTIRNMEMEGREFEGSLRVFKFPEILQFLSLGKRTGTLELTQDARRVDLNFRDGKIFSVNTPERSMRLGQMLVYSGHVSRDALDKALEIQDIGGGSKFLGEILLEQGAIPLDPLKDALKHQLEEDIWDLFSWDSGNFRFDQSSVRAGGAVEVELEIAPLLAEGQRRMQDWQQMCQTITNPQEVFRINPEFSGPPDQPLDEKVWRVLSLINGRLTVESLVRLSNLGKFATYWALDHLLRAEIISRAQDGSSRDSRPVRPPSGPGIGGASTVRLNVNDVSGGADDPLPISEPQKSKKSSKGGKGFLGLIKSAPATEAKPEIHHDIPKECFSDVGLVCDVLNILIYRLIEAGVFPQASASEMVGWIWRAAEQRHPRADILDYQNASLSSDLYDRYARLEGGISRALAGSHDDCLEALRYLWNRLKEKAAESKGSEKEAAAILDKVIQGFASTSVILQAQDFSLSRWKEGLLGPVSVPATESSHRR